ncbi:MAG: hypothetical protein IJ437_00970 [Clostridia bacterium]|nr:hypothetical protein [Clostridia bacterium]
MTEKQTRLVHLIYGIALSLLLVALGVCFALSCLDIYQSGEASPFTPEAIKSHFMSILVPTILCIVAIIGGACLHIFMPAEDKKIRSSVSDKVVIRNLSKRIDFKEAPTALVKVVKSQRGFRLAFLIITIFNAIVNAVSAALHLVSAMGDYYAPDVKVLELPFETILPIILTTLSYSIIPIFVIAVYLVFASFTYEKELEAVRGIVEHNAKKGNPVSKKESHNEKACFLKKHSKKLKIALQCIILVLSITLIALGALNVSGNMNEFDFVSSLANRICTGCIGLG